MVVRDFQNLLSKLELLGKKSLFRMLLLLHSVLSTLPVHGGPTLVRLTDRQECSVVGKADPPTFVVTCG